MDRATKSLNMCLFAKLPCDMKWYIRKFIDYDTKIRLIIDNNRDFMTNRNLYSILTLEQLRKATRHGLVEKLYGGIGIHNEYVSTGHGEIRVSTINMSREMADAFPKPVRHRFRCHNGLPKFVDKFHPMIEEVYNGIGSTAYITSERRAQDLLTGFNALKNIRSSELELLNGDYLLSKRCFQLLVSLMIYCDVVKNERVEKCQRALANLTIKKAVREKKRLETQIQNTRQTMQDLDEENTKMYQSKIKRMSTRFMKENVYMQYVNQGMTLREAKEKLKEDNEIKKQQTAWKKVYIKAVKQAISQRQTSMKEKARQEKQNMITKKQEEIKRKKIITQVTKSIKLYTKLAKQASRIAKKKFAA